MIVGPAIQLLLDGHHLSRADARELMGSIMDGEATEAQIAGFLVALRTKGETADEIAGFAEAMREHVVPVTPQRSPVVDIVGTGGDGAHTFNISTAAALVAAAAGAAVAKHGNRAASSQAGSADVLEELGIALEQPPERIALSIDDLGFGFMFARAHHPAMRFVAPVRQEIGIRTVFNVLGPLANPAGACDGVFGVYSPALVPLFAEALAELGARRAFVVHGEGGLDELSPSGPSLVAEIVDGDVSEWELDPRDLGIEPTDPAELRGGSAAENAVIVRAVLTGEPGGAARCGAAERLRRARRSGTGGRPRRGHRPRRRDDRLRRRRKPPRRARRVQRRGRGLMGRFDDALSEPGLGAIAEIKRRSPSAGDLRPDADPAVIAPAYARAGAAAISVLVDERFGGTWDDLRAARAATTAPLLAKGFFSTDEHLRTAKEAGADAVLLLLRDLDDGETARLMEVAESLGLDTLVEAHDAAELDRGIALRARVLGVNARDLATFSIDRKAQLELVARIPADRIVIAESGIQTRAQGAAAELAGADAVLVGSTLMRAPDPGAKLAELLSRPSSRCAG